MSDRVTAVFLEQDDEEYAPPARLLKVAFHEGGVLSDGTELEPVIFIQIGDYKEGTHEFEFKSDAARSFSVTRHDLFRALLGLGVIDAAWQPEA